MKILEFIKNLGIVKLLYSRKGWLIAVALYAILEAWRETQSETIVLAIVGLFSTILAAIGFEDGMKARSGVGGSNDPKDDKPAEADE